MDLQKAEHNTLRNFIATIPTPEKMTEIQKQPLVSVIVPIYNAERTLGRCVASILAQTLSDIEVVLVNDGSRDGSGAICDEIAASDPRVKVVHKPNEGVAATRMVGIRTATGEYSIQVDSDDWVEPEMIEELYRKATEECVDMVICDFYYDYNGRKPLKRRVQKPSDTAPLALLAETLEYRRLSPSCANKLIRHECYKKYRVVIPSDISHGEDFFVCLSLLRNPDIKVAYLPKAYYHYVQESSSASLTHSYSIKDFERESRLKDYVLEMMQGHPYYDRVERRMIHNLVRRAFNGGVFSSAEFKQLTYAYRHNIRYNRHISWHRRWRLYLSCVGCYRLMYGYRSLSLWFKRAAAKREQNKRK